MNENKITVEKIEETLKKDAVQIEKKITSELEPFINRIYRMGATTRNFKVFKEAYAYFAEKYESKQKLFASIITSDISVSDVKDKLYLLFLYLGLIESVANTIVDILVMLLVANEVDFHIECRGYRTPRIRHVVSLKQDLEKECVPLGTKISFLRENGFSTICSIIDSKLRNDIAHLKFNVREDEIYVNGKRVVDIAFLNMVKLKTAIDTVEKLLTKLAKGKGLIPKGSNFQ